MKIKNYVLASTVFVALAIFGLAFAPSFNSVSGENKGLAIGAKMESFTLADASGKQHKIDDLAGKNGTALIFLSVQCPVVNKNYAARLAQLGKDYAAKGVNVVGLNSNATETAEQVKSNITERGYMFPVLIDKGNVIADKLGATVTPELFLFDKDNKLVYHGAIDNDRAGDNTARAEYARDAVEAVSTGKVIVKTESASFGCSIKRAAQ